MDINSLKARLQGLNRGGQKKSKDIWKPNDKHEVRFIPYPFAEDPLVELFFHYEIGDAGAILCPNANFGEECDVCILADKLKSYNMPDGTKKAEHVKKADWELFRKIQAKARILIPMVERGKEGEGAKFWNITPNQAVELLDKCADGDRLAELGIDKDDTKNALQVLFNPEKAYDATVDFAKAGEKGNTKSFATVKIDLKIKTSPLLVDKKAREDLLASVKNLSEVYPKVTSEDVSKALKKFMNSGMAEAKPEGGKEYKAKAPTNSGESATKKGGRSIDEAFGDMLKE